MATSDNKAVLTCTFFWLKAKVHQIIPVEKVTMMIMSNFAFVWLDWVLFLGALTMHSHHITRNYSKMWSHIHQYSGFETIERSSNWSPSIQPNPHHEIQTKRSLLKVVIHVYTYQHYYLPIVTYPFLNKIVRTRQTMIHEDNHTKNQHIVTNPPKHDVLYCNVHVCHLYINSTDKRNWRYNHEHTISTPLSFVNSHPLPFSFSIKNCSIWISTP